MPPGPLLEVRELSKSFPGVRALDDVRLDVRAGTVHALMGENGAGKSTLMRILAGLEIPDAGTVRFRGAAIRLRHPYQALRRGISMIHQELLPFPELTVAENIFMGHEPVRGVPGWIDRRRMEREAGRILERLGAAIPPRRRMGDLGVAAMQIVEIAKAIAHRSALLIMDEPTSALSTREVDALFRIIVDLKSAGAAVIYISHKLDEVFRIADEATILRDGRWVGTHPINELDASRMIAMMVGREISPAHGGAPGEPGEVLIEARGLGRAGAFRDVSFSLRRGEIVGIAGLMGAGRTALLRALYGLDPCDAGRIVIRGAAVRIASPRDALARGIALAGEDRKADGLVPGMSVKHNLTLASLRRCCHGPFISHAAENRAADECIHDFGIRTPNSDRPAGLLSGGNQQKIVIAKALLCAPDVLLLDEPTRGIDIAAKADVHAIIRRLALQGRGVLVASSELPEVLSLSHRILVMRAGRVVAELNPRTASQEDVMRHAMQN